MLACRNLDEWTKMTEHIDCPEMADAIAEDTKPVHAVEGTVPGVAVFAEDMAVADDDVVVADAVADADLMAEGIAVSAAE